MAPKNQPQQIDPSVFADPTPDDVDMPTGYSIDFGAIPMQEELLPVGAYDATIVNAEPTQSKAGNPMIKLRWRIDGGEYNARSVFDQLVFVTPTGDWNSDYPLRKIRELLEAIGHPAGQINPESLIGESCLIKIKIDQGKGINPETQEPYPPKNAVANYAPAGSRRKVDDLL